MTGTVPYQQLYDDSPAPEPVVFRFKCTGEDFLMAEYYCVNPGCDCYNAELVFVEMFDGQISEMGSFFVLLDVKSGTVADFGAFASGLNLGQYIREFMEILPRFKERLAGHVRRARWVRQAPMHPEDLTAIAEQAERMRQARSGHQPVVIDPLPAPEPTDVEGQPDTADHFKIAEFIREGQTVGFYEVFGRKENEGFVFEYDDNAWYEVDDQYCMNPQCPCNEAVLHFIKIDKATDRAAVEFVIRQKFNTREYEIAVQNCDKDQLDPVVRQFWSRCPGALKALKNRYGQMKEAGQKSLQAANAPTSAPAGSSAGGLTRAVNGAAVSPSGSAAGQPKKPAAAVGRNDPCPCGSGKKFKRCCGAN